MGLPLSEAALRRRRRQRRRVAAFASAEVFGSGGGSSGSNLGVQDSPARTHVPGESGGGSGGGSGGRSLGVHDSPARALVPGESGGYIDVRGHVVAALRCLAEALELQGYDVGHFAKQAWAEGTGDAAFSWCDFSGMDIATLEGAAELKGVFPGTIAEVGGVFAAEVGKKASLSRCEQITGIGRPTSPVVQSDIIADVGGVAVAVQHVDVTQQVEAEFFDCCVEQTTDDEAASALGPGLGLFTIPAVDAERSDAVLRDLLDLREAVHAVQDVPGRSKQQCFAAVRSALARSAEISDLSPVAAAVLAEIQLHIGQPSLPAVSGDHALPAGSFDADALLEGVFADDLEPEGLCVRGSSMQEVVVTSSALDLESEGLCARGISPPETAHVSFGHGGEERVICVSPRVCRQVFRCVSVIPLCVLHFSLLCVLLGMGVVNHPLLEFEVADVSSGGQDVALVLGQVVLTGGLEVQVSVEALVGEFSGRTVEPTVSTTGLKTKKKTVKQAVSEETVKQALSKKAAAKASSGGRGEVAWSAADYEGNQLLLLDQGVDFRSSDRDGDESISLPEFRLVSRRVSVSASRSGGADEIFHLIDEDKNGALDITEFLEGIWMVMAAGDVI